LEFALLFCAALDEDITKSHADDLVCLRVHTLESVLDLAVVPPGERAGGVGLSELGGICAIGEEDVNHDLSHLLALEGGEVHPVDVFDLGDQRREDSVAPARHTWSVTTYLGLSQELTRAGARGRGATEDPETP
jgi:hypothetical protein